MPDNIQSKTVAEKIAIANQVYANYPLFHLVLTDIDRCHYSPKIKGKDDPDCLLLVGNTGSGKTTILETYLESYPRKDTDDGSIVPVMYTLIPPPASVKGLVTNMLEKLGDPLYEKGSTIVQTIRLYRLLNECKVELIILDEFHHFIDRESKKVLVTLCDWLKSLIVNTKIPVVLFGMPISENILKVDNWQLSRRFNYRHNLVPFPQDEAGLNLFRGFLSEIEGQLPLLGKSNLAGKSLSERIYYATDGTIGHVMTLIRKGATYAIEHDSSCIDLDILHATYWKYLKHEKLFKKTDPFLEDKFDMEASYAQDRESTENQSYSNKKKKKKKSVSDINKMLTT